jgi:hypothetical protein
MTRFAKSLAVARRLAWAVLPLLGVILSQLAYARTLEVPSSYPTIQSALDVAGDGPLPERYGDEQCQRDVGSPLVTTLSAGIHTLTADVTDSGGLSSADVITLPEPSAHVALAAAIPLLILLARREAHRRRAVSRGRPVPAGIGWTRGFAKLDRGHRTRTKIFS